MNIYQYPQQSPVLPICVTVSSEKNYQVFLKWVFLCKVYNQIADLAAAK